MGVLSSTRPSPKGGWFLLPPEQEEGAPLEDSSPASEGLSTTRWESQVSSLWRHPHEWRISEGGEGHGPAPSHRADGWYIEGQLLNVFPLIPVLRVDSHSTHF